MWFFLVFALVLSIPHNAFPAHIHTWRLSPYAHNAQQYVIFKENPLFALYFRGKKIEWQNDVGQQR